MKLEKRKVNEFTKQLENFKKERLGEDLELDDKVIIEVPIVMGSQLKDIQKNKEIASKVAEETQKMVDEFKKDEEKNIAEAKKQIKSFLGTLDEHYKDLYLKEGNDYTVHCKGRRELRNLIEQCKENNIRYKWDKLVEGDFRYDVKFSLTEDFLGDEEPVGEEPSNQLETPAPQPEPVQPEAINLDNLKLGDAIIVTQNLLDALMQTKQSVEQMVDLVDNASEPITPENEQEIFPVEQDTETKVEEGLKLNEDAMYDDTLAFLNEYGISEDTVSHSADYLWTWLKPYENPDVAYFQRNADGKADKQKAELLLDKFYSVLKIKVNQLLEEGKKVRQERIDKVYAQKENLQPKDLGQTQINEGLAVLGSLEDYAPSDKAKPLYDEIVAEGMLGDLDKLLGEIYQDGASIDELNNLLANEKDFVRSMLGLDEVSLQDEEDQEFEQSVINEIEDEDVKPASEKEPQPQSKGSVNDYFSDSTGYGEDDEDDDLGLLQSIVDSKDAEEM